ncbi:MAG: DNA internalization-related competence protein ComEC/Rec2 [Gammaproteobacteria bacterium]
MFKVAIAFLLGIYSLTVFAGLPHWYWAFCILPIVLIVIKYPRCYLVVSLSLGFFWALIHAHMGLYPQLDKKLEGIDVDITGQIVSIPNERGRSARFEFTVNHANLSANGNKVQLPKKIRLNWYGNIPSLQLGEVWRLRVRLKRPWSYANPGGFDYEKWLFAQGIRATGYVRSKGDNQRLRATNILNPAFYLRSTLNNKLEQTNVKSVAIIKALVLGERGQMDSERWQVFTQTGTNHLLAISGLHVGIVSGFVYFAVIFLWKRCERFCLKVAAQRVAALAAIFAAMLYAMLAGFSIPTQRAMVMATVVFIAIFTMQSLRPWNILSLALLCVLFLDPFSVLSPGFWLSFVAVAIILFSIKEQSISRSKWRSLVHIQLVLSVGLLPLTLIFFQQASLVSPIANLFAVPWVSIMVVPITLIGSFFLLVSQNVGLWILNISNWLLEMLWLFLNALHSIPFASWHHAVPLWALVPAVFGIILVLMPKGWPTKALSIVLLSPLLLAGPSETSNNELRLTILDVGQGLAIVVEASNQVLVFDTGPKFNESFNAGEAVVVPYLRYRGISHIDKLIVSHGDKDHAGGLQGILANMPVGELVSTFNEKYKHNNLSTCGAGVAWQWGEVYFKFLYPSEQSKLKAKLSSNNSSCVLHIQHPSGSILLTGDIEKSVEKQLLETYTDLLDVDILIAPHHGSNSSSTNGFIHAVSPKYVVFATGYRNPYGFPDEKVVSRYKEFGSHLVNTASHGMITFIFSNKNGLQLQPGYREVQQRFWHSKS